MSQNVIFGAGFWGNGKSSVLGFEYTIQDEGLGKLFEKTWETLLLRAVGKLKTGVMKKSRRALNGRRSW